MARPQSVLCLEVLLYSLEHWKFEWLGLVPLYWQCSLSSTGWLATMSTLWYGTLNLCTKGNTWGKLLQSLQYSYSSKILLSSWQPSSMTFPVFHDFSWLASLTTQHLITSFTWVDPGDVERSSFFCLSTSSWTATSMQTAGLSSSLTSPPNTCDS